MVGLDEGLVRGLEGKVLLRRWSVGRRRQGDVGGVSSILLEAHRLALRLAILVLVLKRPILVRAVVTSAPVVTRDIPAATRRASAARVIVWAVDAGTSGATRTSLVKMFGPVVGKGCVHHPALTRIVVGGAADPADIFGGVRSLEVSALPVGVSLLCRLQRIDVVRDEELDVLQVQADARSSDVRRVWLQVLAPVLDFGLWSV